MRNRTFVVALGVALLTFPLPATAATSKKSARSKKAPDPVTANPVAGDDCPHDTAMLLAKLSDDGKKSIRFKASARGRYFFFEEPAGVTVYVYGSGDSYHKQDFLPGQTIEKAEKNYDLTGALVKPK